MLKGKLKGKGKIITISLIAILLMSIVIASLGDGNVTDALIISKKPFTEKIVAVGQLGLEQETTLIAQVNGVVEAISVKEGDTVIAGSPLIEIENQVTTEYASAVSEYNRLSSLISYSKISYDNSLVLYSEGAISKNEMESKKHEYESITAQLASAQLKVEQVAEKISKYKISVPWDAVVLKTYVAAGDYTQIGDPLADIGSIGGYKIDAELDEKYFPYLKIGLPVSISVGDTYAMGAEGIIDSITPKINSNTGTFEIKVLLPEDYQYQVSNLTVNLEIIINKIDEAIVIPQSYVFEKLNNKEAYVLVYDNGKAIKRQIKIQTGISSKVLVLDGLKEGDIVLSPQAGLMDGADVKKYKEAIDL